MIPKSARATVGVVVMAHGTPSRLDDLEEFFTRIRRGRRPEDHELAELRRRYEAIGGISPLGEKTRAQVEVIASALDSSAGPGSFLVSFGAKMVEPSIEGSAAAVVEELGDKLSGVVGVVLAPHFAAASVGVYASRLESALKALGFEGPCRMINSWFDDPEIVEAIAERVLRFGSPDFAKTRVLFSAHSLPVVALGPDDPYVSQLKMGAGLVAEKLGSVDFRVCFQSAGMSGGEWVGPDLHNEIRSAAEDGIARIIVCPHGFVSDHLEVLYDLDIEARAIAESVGLQFYRAESLNDDPRLGRAIAGLVTKAVEGFS